MEFLIRLLQEENDVRENDDSNELHFATRMVQIRDAFEPDDRKKTAHR
jgi:hypothetical protein